MKRYIGGFLELEVYRQPSPDYHAGAIALCNARACISHLITQTAMRRVWVPYYTCNALLEPFERVGIPYSFYALRPNLTIAEGTLPDPMPPGDYLVYINYFGLQNSYIQELIGQYGVQLIVDNTQDFFNQGYQPATWAFNSARKSFGVPDGGYLYGPAELLGTTAAYPENTDYQVQYLADRLRGAQQQAYEGFIAYERTLSSIPLRISGFSAALLSQIDIAAAADIRRANFRRYHTALASYNNMSLSQDWENLLDDPNTVPFCYPFLPAIAVARELLFASDIFVPWLWRDTLLRTTQMDFIWELDLTARLMPLPLDQRYGPDEINRVIIAVSQLLSNNSNLVS